MTVAEDGQSSPQGVGMTVAEDGQSSRFQCLLSLTLCAIYMALSFCLVLSNKILMGNDYFPFPIALATIHMSASVVCSCLLYSVMAPLYPSMQRMRGRMYQLLPYCLTLASVFAMSIVLSNAAYVYCSVAFIQFMKGFNICIIFALSCWVGSQVFDRMKFVIVCWIMCGLALAVTGEIHFVLIGFLFQLTSQLGDVSRQIMQEWILNASDVKLDPLTYLLLIAPCSLAVLTIVSAFTYDPLIPERMLAHWHLLVPNALVAFALNVSTSMVVKHTSAMALTLASISKDIALVVSSTYLLGDALSLQQGLGFVVAIGGMLMWTFAKVQPNHPVVEFLANLSGMPVGEDDTPAPDPDAEKQALCSAR